MTSVLDFLDKENLVSAGVLIGIMLSLSPIPTFIDIAIHTKSTGGYTVAPYVSSLLCCSTWLTYALISGGSKSDLIPLNTWSLVIYLAYCATYLYFSDNKTGVIRIYVSALGLLALTVIIAIIFKSLVVIGTIATVANCVMFAAPLAVMHQVIQTKSVRYMPFLLSFTSFLCASVWLLWALMARDYFVLIPNALGTFFGIVQLILYLMYWRHSRETSSELARYQEPPTLSQE
jgi:solute carrier family 50 protein (sugar transporter)